MGWGSQIAVLISQEGELKIQRCDLKLTHSGFAQQLDVVDGLLMPIVGKLLVWRGFQLSPKHRGVVFTRLD